VFGSHPTFLAQKLVLKLAPVCSLVSSSLLVSTCRHDLSTTLRGPNADRPVNLQPAHPSPSPSSHSPPPPLPSLLFLSSSTRTHSPSKQPLLFTFYTQFHWCTTGKGGRDQYLSAQGAVGFSRLAVTTCDKASSLVASAGGVGHLVSALCFSSRPKRSEGIRRAVDSLSLCEVVWWAPGRDGVGPEIPPSLPSRYFASVLHACLDSTTAHKPQPTTPGPTPRQRRRAPWQGQPEQRAPCRPAG
jgi:hypothetical protein